MQFDYLCFATASLVVFALLQVRAWRAQRSRRALAISSLLVAGVLAGGWFFIETAGLRAQANVEQMVRGYAPTYARELERMGHAALTLETTADDPNYLAMIEAQKRWLSANPNIADTYTFRRTADGKVALLVDSETDYDRNGRFEGNRDERTEILGNL